MLVCWSVGECDGVREYVGVLVSMLEGLLVLEDEDVSRPVG